MTHAEYTKLEESLKKAGWRQDWKPPKRVRVPSKNYYSYFTKKFSTFRAYVQLGSEGFFIFDAYLVIPGVKKAPEGDRPGRLTLTEDHHHVPTVAEIEEEAKRLIAYHLSHTKKQDRISEIDWTWVDDGSYREVTGKTAFDLWKKKVESVLREWMRIEKNHGPRWLLTDRIVDLLLEEGGYNLLEYPITREMGSKVIRKILEKLAKEGVVEKTGGPRSGTKGGQYEWRAL